MFGRLVAWLVATLVVTASSHSKLCHTDQTRPNDQDDQDDQGGDKNQEWDENDEWDKIWQGDTNKDGDTNRVLSDSEIRSFAPNSE